ncbi:hypothetical protein Tco_0238020 [Tanacetum coccineum]
MRLVLRGVKHIPDLRLNLIFADKLDDEGFCKTFNNRKWRISRGVMDMVRDWKFSTLYLTQAKFCKQILVSSALRILLALASQEQVANMMREHAVETTMWEAPERIPCEDEDEDVDGDGDGGDGDGVSQSDDE